MTLSAVAVVAVVAVEWRAVSAAAPPPAQGSSLAARRARCRWYTMEPCRPRTATRTRRRR